MRVRPFLGSGEIRYDEFLAAAMSHSEMASEDSLKEAFAFFDLANNGKISPEEFQAVLGETVTDKEWTHVHSNSKLERIFSNF